MTVQFKITSLLFTAAHVSEIVKPTLAEGELFAVIEKVEKDGKILAMIMDDTIKAHFEPYANAKAGDYMIFDAEGTLLRVEAGPVQATESVSTETSTMTTSAPKNKKVRAPGGSQGCADKDKAMGSAQRW